MHGVEAAGDGVDTGAPCRHPRRRPARRAAWQPHLSAAGRRRPDHRSPFDLGRARLSRHRPGAFLAEGYRPGEVRLGHRRGSAGRLPAAVASWKASFRRWNPPMRWPMSRKIAPKLPKDHLIVVNLCGPRRQGHLRRRRTLWAPSCERDEAATSHRQPLRRAEARRPRRPASPSSPPAIPIRTPRWHLVRRCPAPAPT